MGSEGAPKDTLACFSRITQWLTQAARIVSYLGTRPKLRSSFDQASIKLRSSFDQALQVLAGSPSPGHLPPQGLT
ncbi:hypothetical protein E4U55_006864 [Claviceps digitariae]|nr:hypothetical protein E4U55_006864 [Claviceps digitariae]